MTDTNITEEMIDKCAHAYAAADGYDWVDVSQLWQGRYRRQAAAGLGAALAGYTVVQLPEPTAKWSDGTSYWDAEARTIMGEADSAGRPFIRVDGKVWLTSEATAVALALLAAVRESARLASESSGGETP